MTIYLFIYYYLPRIASSILLNYLPCETPTKEPCRISNDLQFSQAKASQRDRTRNPSILSSIPYNYSATDSQYYIEEDSQMLSRILTKGDKGGIHYS